MTERSFKRRRTHEVRVGGIKIGGENPIRLQSMTNTQTLDTERSVKQILALAEAGAELVRLTAQGVSHAANLAIIKEQVRNAGSKVPLVADIHFNPAAAVEAARHVEKVRINPGNFVDPGRTFRQLEFTDEQYAAELARLEEKLVPFLELCRKNGTAIRIGVNHGSLSDRIMSRYGDTPAGMVESAMEFLRVCVKHNFGDVVISIKASNVCVMVETVRLLVKEMEKEGMNFPLHLGVTEAGDGEDGRVKSAVGIGALLAQGIGDTIRVSLSEDPVNEIPVASMLVKHVKALDGNVPEGKTGRFERPLIVGLDLSPEEATQRFHIVEVSGNNAARDAKMQLISYQGQKPAMLKINYPPTITEEELTIAASVDFGASLLDGYAGAVWLDAPGLTGKKTVELLQTILQATRRRISKTEYIACPGCGRTLFDLADVLARVKEATSHLKHLKIGVMGCIVNGPGEMADADYGYVGAATGKVSLYKKKECIKRNIPADQAVEELVQLIKLNGDWIEPDTNQE